MREPSEAQPNPMLDTLLPRASTLTSFIAITHFSNFHDHHRYKMVHQSQYWDGSYPLSSGRTSFDWTRHFGDAPPPRTQAGRRPVTRHGRRGSAPCSRHWSARATNEIVGLSGAEA